MRLILVLRKSIHDNADSAFGEIFNEIKLNNTSLTLSAESGKYLHTSSVKSITIETNNSTYRFERIEE